MLDGDLRVGRRALHPVANPVLAPARDIGAEAPVFVLGMDAAIDRDLEIAAVEDVPVCRKAAIRREDQDAILGQVRALPVVDLLFGGDGRGVALVRLIGDA